MPSPPRSLPLHWSSSCQLSSAEKVTQRSWYLTMVHISPLRTLTPFWKTDISHRKSAVYYPQANGEIERFNRSLKESLLTATIEGKDWKTFTTVFLQTYWATLQSCHNTAIPCWTASWERDVHQATCIWFADSKAQHTVTQRHGAQSTREAEQAKGVHWQTPWSKGCELWMWFLRPSEETWRPPKRTIQIFSASPSYWAKRISHVQTLRWMDLEHVSCSICLSKECKRWCWATTPSWHHRTTSTRHIRTYAGRPRCQNSQTSSLDSRLCDDVM